MLPISINKLSQIPTFPQNIGNQGSPMVSGYSSGGERVPGRWCAAHWPGFLGVRVQTPGRRTPTHVSSIINSAAGALRRRRGLAQCTALYTERRTAGSLYCVPARTAVLDRVRRARAPRQVTSEQTAVHTSPRYRAGVIARTPLAALKCAPRLPRTPRLRARA